MKLIWKFNLVLLAIFLAGFVIIGTVSYLVLQSNARAEILDNASVMMESALSSRSYTNSQIKPLLETQLKYTFLPQSVPAYAATEQFNDLRKKYPDYSYKEATLNPTNPRDRATDWEADVVNQFRNDASKTELVGERDTPTGRSLYLARPITIKDPACLACHTTAAQAPKTMVELYGQSNGFGWKLNETIGAQIVSVPMSVPLKLAAQAHHAMLVSLVGVFVLILVLLNVLLWFSILRPIRRLSRMADAVSTGNLDVPEVKFHRHDEIAVLAGSFNRMRISLTKALKMLEDE